MGVHGINGFMFEWYGYLCICLLTVIMDGAAQMDNEEFLPYGM